MAYLDTEFVDVCERPPIPVLAAEVEYPAIDRESLGVLHTTPQRVGVEQTRFDAGYLAEAYGGLGVGIVKTPISDGADDDSALSGCFKRGQQRLERTGTIGVR